MNENQKAEKTEIEESVSFDFDDDKVSVVADINSDIASLIQANQDENTG